MAGLPACPHLAEDGREWGRSPKCQQCFLPPLLVAPRISGGLQRNDCSAFFSPRSAPASLARLISHTKIVLKGLLGCLAPFCQKWKVMNAALRAQKHPAATHILNNILLPSCRTHFQGHQHLLAPKKKLPKPWPQPLGCDLCTSFQLQLQPKGSQSPGTTNQHGCAPGNGFWAVYSKDFQAWLVGFFPLLPKHLSLELNEHGV